MSYVNVVKAIQKLQPSDASVLAAGTGVEALYYGESLYDMLTRSLIPGTDRAWLEEDKDCKAFQGVVKQLLPSHVILLALNAHNYPTTQ